MPANAWREFLRANAGKGYVMKELSERYREMKAKPKKKKEYKEDPRETEDTVHTTCTSNKTEAHCGGNPGCVWQRKPKKCISRSGTKSHGLVFQGPFGEY